MYIAIICIWWKYKRLALCSLISRELDVTAVSHRGPASDSRNFYNYAYCFRSAFVSLWGETRVYAPPCVNGAHWACGVSYVRRTCMHDRRRHLVRPPSPIINARHMPRSLIRRFYTPVCPVCLWWHVTAVKAAPAAGVPFERSIPRSPRREERPPN